VRAGLAAILVFLVAGCAPSGEEISSDGAVDTAPRVAEANSGASGLDYIFDDRVIRNYEVTLPATDWQWLQEHARDEQYVRASLRVDGVEYDPIGIRYKGGPGTLRRCFDRAGNRTCPKLSIKLKFNQYDPELRFHGVKRLNFNSMKSDGSQMRSAISYGLFRAAGVFAPRAHYATLTVNGAPQGLLALTEQVDGRFTRSRFPDGGKGNLYKEVWPKYLAPERYLPHLKTNEDENPSADRMVRFAKALAAATDETFVSVLESWTDLDALMRYLAVDRLIDNWDGIVAWYCLPRSCSNHNYYWYEDSDQDRLWLIPWDLDNTFNEPRPMRPNHEMPDWDVEPTDCEPFRISRLLTAVPPGCDPLMRRLATLTWQRYVAATRDILATSFRVDLIHARIDALEILLEDEVAADPYGPSMTDWRKEVRQLKSSVTAKHAYIAAKIAD